MIYHKEYGCIEAFIPSMFKPNSLIEVHSKRHAFFDNLKFSSSNRGCTLEFELLPEEKIYGFGLQMKSFEHSGSKKTMRANADALSDSGDSHAPVPFFITSKKRGVLINTARYASFYIGRARNKGTAKIKQSEIKTDTNELYRSQATDCNIMYIEVPISQGVDVYYFEGTPLEIVMEYNLLSGGGFIPPEYGLGPYYRCYAKSNDSQILSLCDYFKRQDLPISVIGLEPGWQSHSYSSSFCWDSERFPNPEKFIKKTLANGYQLNLWQQPFISPASKLYKLLQDYSADFTVWQGLVPDFSMTQCSQVFSDYLKEEFTSKGISGFKLDECDGSDFTGGWSFPDSSNFPSGLDGEQMHSLFGTLYLKAVMNSTEPQKAVYGQVRNAGLFCSSYPFVLYSDLYDKRDYLLAVVNSGLSGLLFAPEVRHADCKNDLVRRFQNATFSAQMIINCWYKEIPPWLEHDAENEIKQLLKLRLSLIPYLLSAFYKYKKLGKPPIRPLFLDYPNSTEAYSVNDEYMFGDNMLVAPIIDEKDNREIFLPEGTWFDFWTGEKFSGGKFNYICKDIPVFIKSNSIIPLNTFDGDEKTICFHCYGKEGEFDLIRQTENGLVLEKVSFDEKQTLLYEKTEDNLKHLTKYYF